MNDVTDIKIISAFPWLCVSWILCKGVMFDGLTFGLKGCSHPEVRAAEMSNANEEEFLLKA